MSISGGTCRVAVGQMSSVDDQAANFATCKKLAVVSDAVVGCATPVDAPKSFIQTACSTFMELPAITSVAALVAAQEAAAAGCKMLFLPECFSFIGSSQPEVRVGALWRRLHCAAPETRTC